MSQKYAISVLLQSNHHLINFKHIVNLQSRRQHVFMLGALDILPDLV